jgi:hypothetical protein
MKSAAILILPLVLQAGPLDGSRDVYLTLGHAARATSGWGEARDGASVTGAPLRIGSAEFARGIGTHAPAELVFRASGKYRWLAFHAGVSAEMTQSGSITVQVWLDGKKVHETPVMRVKEEPRYVCLPVAGADEIRLVGTDAGNGNGADHVNLGHLRLTVGEKEPAPDAPVKASSSSIASLKDLAGAVPKRGSASTEPAKKWEFAFVTGNGRLGAMVHGHPSKEILTGNHARLFLPLGSREILPDLAKHVPELRQIIRAKGYGAAMNFFLGKAKEQGFPGILWTDPFHPGFVLRIDQPPQGEIRDYVRTEDFATGEVAVRWKDDAGARHRRCFVSRTDHAIVLSIGGAGKVSCVLTPEPVPEPRIRSELKIDGGWAVYHNTYTHGKGGFDAAIRIVPSGGKVEADGTAVRIEGADEVLLLMRIEPWKASIEGSDAWATSPKHPDFAGGAKTDLRDSLKQSLGALPADYAKLFEPHAKAHGELFNRVTLDLGGGADRDRTSEDLLDVAAKEDRLPAALREKMFDAGRYMFLCSALEQPPNLQGIWTGSWKPAWSGDYTTDTNLQLAIKVGFSGNLPELMEGYFRLIENALPDWRLNAKRYYGCRGVLAPPRMSNNGLMLHWGGWNGIWWTAGAGWLAHFFTDYYHYTGDREFLARRAVPLLKEVVLFYEDFLLMDEKTGKYEFIPSYSPESSDGITSTMDVMVAKEALSSLIEACETLKTDAESLPKWKAMLSKMPAYRINKDGALAEWVPEGDREFYGHRHLSHLHSAYEANGELTPEGMPEIWAAAQEATRRRINGKGEQSTHGRMHMGLTAACLRMGEEAYGRLAIMATKKSMYPSLICSHEPNQGIFNTDGNGSIPEIVSRMLVSSWPGRLDLLPALPAALPRGSIRGILARQGIRIDRLEWDRPAGTIALELTSRAAQSVAVRVPEAKSMELKVVSGTADVKPGPTPNGRTVGLPAGEKVSLEIKMD